MPLDACYLKILNKELKVLENEKIEKIYQPSKEEIVFSLKGKRKLCLCALASGPNIRITEKSFENPAVPPLFCMILRKHLTGAFIDKIYMPAFERTIFIDFICQNDLMEKVKKTIIFEIMGRNSNIIFVDENKKIIDLVKKVDITMSSKRQLFIGMSYSPAPAQDKIEFINAKKDDISKLFDFDKPLSDAIMQNYSGISPLIAREISYLSSGETTKIANSFTDYEKQKVIINFEKIIENVNSGKCTPTIIFQKDKKTPLDFTFMDIMQYQAATFEEKCSSLCEVLDKYYSKSADRLRLNQRSSDVLNFLTKTISRLEKTKSIWEKDIIKSQNCEKYKVYGELIYANLHLEKPGQKFIEVLNYYTGENEKISVNPAISLNQNAQKYFKKYTKLKNSKSHLEKLIKNAENELNYLDSVFYLLSVCETVGDVDQIRDELIQNGYLKRAKAQNKKPSSKSKPRTFISSDGFKILVGKNNLQNDYITTKLSRKNDIWLHTKNIHSSHVLIVTQNQSVPDKTIFEAASLCAYYSKGKNDSKVLVDFCPVSHVKKPNGAKAGMVVYENYNSIMVSPNKEILKEIN